MSFTTTVRQALGTRGLAAMLSFVLAAYKLGTEQLGLDDPLGEAMNPANGAVHRAANAGAVITAVVIGVVALVGILIFAQVNSSLPEPNNSDLAASQDAVVGGFGGAMELVPVILIVLLASIVIIYVQRMRQ